MTIKDEEKLVTKLFKGLMKENKHLLYDMANFTFNQRGGSAKGWAFEESSVRLLENEAVSIQKGSATEPNTDYIICFLNDSIPIQAKAYTLAKPSDKAQMSTMAKTSYFEDSLSIFFNEMTGEFDGKGYSKYLSKFNIPMDVLLSTNPEKMNGKLYAFHFISLFSKCTSFVQNKNSISIRAKDPDTNRLREAFRFGPDSSASNDCYNRGIWIQNWFLEKYVKPICVTKIETKDIFGIYMTAMQVERRNQKARKSRTTVAS